MAFDGVTGECDAGMALQSAESYTRLIMDAT